MRPVASTSTARRTESSLSTSKSSRRATPKPKARRIGVAGDAGSLEHYADPAYYTRAYRARRDDVTFYVKEATRSGGPVLEYGVGNGRVALEIAQNGVAVTGIDLSKPMLADFKRRLALEPTEVRRRVKLRHGDMRRVRLGRRFPLVIAPFNTILHLYSRPDLELFFARVREHLLPRGRFVFDFSVPMGEDLSRDPGRAYGSPPFRHPTTGGVVRYAETFDYDAFRQILLVWMEFTPESGAPSFATPLTQRQFFPREMEALLHYNHFSNIRFFSDFSATPGNRFADSLVVQCRVARQRQVES